MNTWERTGKELARVLGNLCAKVDEQANYLRSLGTFPDLDELALEFDDVYINLQVGKNPFLLSAELLDSLREIDAILVQRSGGGNGDFWDILKADQDAWESVRKIARIALDQLHRPKK